MAVCVYALTSAAMPRAWPGRTAGLAGERLRALRVGRIIAIVGDLRRVPSADEPTLRRFDHVIRRLFRSVPALLPARFGTCFDTPDELTTVLRLRQASLGRALRLVRGRAQMTVRVIAPPRTAGSRRETRPARPNPTDPHDAARVSRASTRPQGVSSKVEGGSEPVVTEPFTSGADYLRRRAAERHVPGFEPVRTGVRRWIRAERVERRAAVATIYHLVPRAATTSYRAAVERAAAATGLQCVVTGPWPPYAFADW